MDPYSANYNNTPYGGGIGTYYQQPRSSFSSNSGSGVGGGPLGYSQPFQSYNYGNYGTPYGGGYDPNAGSQHDFGQTNPFTDPYATASYYSSNPQAAFGQFQNSLPGGQSNPYSRYLQNNYYNYYGKYQSDLVNNPYESFGDYMQRMNPQFQSEFSNLSPMLRGESPQMVGRAQYVGF